VTVNLIKPEKIFQKRNFIGYPHIITRDTKESTSNQIAVPGSGMTPIAFPSPGLLNFTKVDMK
jgi:hypothetical protein